MEDYSVITILFTLMNVVVAVIIIGMGIPLIMGKVKPNRMIGVRTHKTLSDEKIWYKANAYTGRVMVFTGSIMAFFSLLFMIVTLFTSVFDNSPTYVILVIYGIIFFAPVIGMVVASMAYIRHL